eukprot:RCo008333
MVLGKGRKPEGVGVPADAAEKGKPEVTKPEEPGADTLGKDEEEKEDTGWGEDAEKNCGAEFVVKGGGLDPEKEGCATAGLEVKEGDAIDVVGVYELGKDILWTGPPSRQEKREKM